MTFDAPPTRAAAADPPVTFRELTSVADLRSMQALEQRVWAAADIDVSPVLLLVALVKCGALALGAFVGDTLQGFAFSVPGERHGHRLHWSHMTGVDDDRRSRGLGTELKREQARRVAARGYRRMQWTYDPLQSLNAHLNLVKLGARVDEYAEHVYGDSSSELHRGAPTDRFIATWDLDESGAPLPSPLLRGLDDTAAQRAGEVHRDDAGWDRYAPAPRLPDARVIRVPTPARFSAMLQDAPDLALAWRLQTREQFQALFARGYQAVWFRRDGEDGEYLLVRE